MQKNIWLLSILSAIIVILVCILIFVPAKQRILPTGFGGDPIITSPKYGAIITSPLKIAGYIDNTVHGWSGFEGQVGTVKLLDSKGNELAAGVLKATTDWTKLPTQFETNLVFDTKISGPAIIIFKNKNPSGDPAKDMTLSYGVEIK